jgi:hypothetical protein
MLSVCRLLSDPFLDWDRESRRIGCRGEGTWGLCVFEWGIPSKAVLRGG